MDLLSVHDWLLILDPEVPSATEFISECIAFSYSLELTFEIFYNSLKEKQPHELVQSWYTDYMHVSISKLIQHRLYKLKKMHIPK